MLKLSDLEALKGNSNVTIEVVPVKRFDIVATLDDGTTIVLDSAESKAKAKPVMDYLARMDFSS